MIENEIVGWHHRRNGHAFEQTPGDPEGQGSLARCSPWGHKELDLTWQLNNNSKGESLVFQSRTYREGTGNHMDDASNVGCVARSRTVITRKNTVRGTLSFH